MSDLVLCEKLEGVALLTLNRPGQLNALNYALIDQLMSLLDAIEDDPHTKAVVMTGAGDKAFSAGADIKEFSQTIDQGPDIALKLFVRRGQAMTARLEAFPKPVIAAVNGLAFGRGCEITEAVHLAIASDSASFAKSEICIGIPPTFGGTQCLPRLAGRKRALEYLLTGDPFSPERAYEIGLISQVVPKDKLLAASFELAHRIMRHSPLATARIISAVTRGLNASIAEGLAIEGEQFARMAATDDTRKALDAWLAHRAPVNTPSSARTSEPKEIVHT